MTLEYNYDHQTGFVSNGQRLPVQRYVSLFVIFYRHPLAVRPFVFLVFVFLSECLCGIDFCKQSISKHCKIYSRDCHYHHVNS